MQRELFRGKSQFGLNPENPGFFPALLFRELNLWPLADVMITRRVKISYSVALICVVLLDDGELFVE